MRLRDKLVYILIGIVAVYFLVCFILARKYVRPGAGGCAEPPPGFTQSEELEAWVSDSIATCAPAFILVHGYGGSQTGWSDVATALRERGFGVVIPSLPGHGSRAKETSGFAVKESEIVLDIVKWIRCRASPPEKVILLGISMGGAACWLATEKDPSISAVVSEGSFARLGPATRRWMNRRVPGISIALYPVSVMVRRMSGVNPKHVNPVESAAKWTGKSLVIHGDQDALFSLDDARALAEAAGGELWIVEGAGHAHCSSADLDAYVDRLCQIAE